MESRGWKPSCPPRVPDEDLTTPFVEHWEEAPTIFDSRQEKASPSEEPGCILPAGLAAPAADYGNGSVAKGSFSSDIPATVVPSQQQNRCASSTGRANQAWDLHWSYTKWAVETMRFARKLAPWQKVNHFRNSNELCRKVFRTDCFCALTVQ